LVELDLANQLGLNRARVRQLIQRLERDLLVERIPRKGAFVSTITAKKLQEIFEIRMGLEGIASRLAALRREGKELDNIMELFEEEGEKPLSEDGLTAKINLGERLHHFIIKSAGNSLIDHAMKPLRLQIYRIWQGSIRIPERINKAFAEHKEIIRAIKDGDGELAEKLMRKHLSHAYHDCVNIMPHV